MENRTFELLGFTIPDKLSWGLALATLAAAVVSMFSYLTLLAVLGRGNATLQIAFGLAGPSFAALLSALVLFRKRTLRADWGALAGVGTVSLMWAVILFVSFSGGRLL